MEQVFVVRRRDFFGSRWPQGFLRAGNGVDTVRDGEGSVLSVAALQSRGFFVDRARAEGDPSLKQIIPYCVLTDGPRIFLVRRRSSGTEERLHDRHSIGLGGHIGPDDGAADDPNLVRSGLLRELHEELELRSFDPSALRFAGLCNDDSDAVGQVHAGLVFRLEVGAQPGTRDAVEVRVREILKLEGRFRPLVEIRDLCEDSRRFESWSRIVLEALFDLPRQGGIPIPEASDQGQVKGNGREEQQRRGAHPGAEP